MNKKRNKRNRPATKKNDGPLFIVIIILGILTSRMVFATFISGSRTYRHTTPTVTPSLTPSPTDVPLPSQTPTATPEATIIPQQTAYSSHTETSQSSPSCDVRIPDRAVFMTVDVGIPYDGSLRLLWPKILGATTVNIFYGEYGKGDEHAVANWPNDGTIRIDSLKNVAYNFCIQGVNRCAVGPRLCVDPIP